jgi:hypothetical protein
MSMRTANVRAARVPEAPYGRPEWMGGTVHFAGTMGWWVKWSQRQTS